MMSPKEKAAKAAKTAANKAASAKKAAAALKAKKKAARESRLAGPKPMTKFDYEFCQAYVQTGKQEAAYRSLCPEHKDPGVAAMRIMKRPEIIEHIREIFKLISRSRQRAAEASAASAILSLEMADERLVEILGTRRRTRGEVLTRDIKELLVPGATAVLDENGRIEGYNMTDALKESLLTDSAPVEDADLLKAIKLTFDRKQGIVKAEKAPDVTFVGAMLYKPKWAINNTPRVIEGQA